MTSAHEDDRKREDGLPGANLANWGEGSCAGEVSLHGRALYWALTTGTSVSKRCC